MALALVWLDINNPEFQKCWFDLEREDAREVLNALTKLQHFDWEQLQKDRRVHWEGIASRVGPKGQRLYSLRLARRVRAVGYREGYFLRLLALAREG